MAFNKLHICRWIVGSLLWLMVSTGCAATQPAHMVQEGEPVSLVYSCTNGKDELVVTTAADAAASSVKKASIFAPLYDPGPVSVIAGRRQLERIDNMTGPADFHVAVSALLAAAVVGKPYGRQETFTIQGTVQKSITDSERFLRLNRRQKRKRQHWMKKESFIDAYQQEPQIGKLYPSFKYPDKIFYRVDAIKEGKVLTRVTFEDDTLTDSPFGQSRYVNVDEEHYETITDTQVGHLVRSGSLVGRVAEVEDTTYTMDYGNPLAGVRLHCETVVSPEGP